VPNLILFLSLDSKNVEIKKETPKILAVVLEEVGKLLHKNFRN